jgi:ankyrin repeat protein
MLEFDAQNGDTALMRANAWGRAECARLLIDAGADKDAKDDVRRRSMLLLGRLLFIFFVFSP